MPKKATTHLPTRFCYRFAVNETTGDARTVRSSGAPLHVHRKSGRASRNSASSDGRHWQASNLGPSAQKAPASGRPIAAHRVRVVCRGWGHHPDRGVNRSNCGLLAR
jgi:hypothetical protein